MTGAVCYTPQGSFYALSIGQSSSFTGLNLTHSYNSRLQPSEFKASSTGGNVIDISYNFVDSTTNKNAGHVFSITNNLDTTRSQTFSYDQVNRITAAQSASTFATSPAHCWGETYGLDPWGNLQSIVPTTNSSYTGCSEESGFTKLADGNNHLATFSYDASGNTANDSTIAYTWDGESQLKTASGVTYSYDSDGRRTAKVGNKLYWYGSGGEILAETDGVGNTLNEYIFFGGQRIAMLPINATPDGSIEQGLTYWTDGTPVQIVTDPAGAHSGNNYLQITTSAPGYTSHSRQSIPVSPGETITFGGWAYRTSGTTGAVRWKLAALDANQNSVGSVNPTPSDVSSATWTDQIGTYTIPAGVAYVYLYAEIYLPTATTVARFDDGFVTTSPLYYVGDQLGTSRVTTRSNGVVCYDADFYPYGGERPYTNGCLENNYKFEGKERDAETGNDDFGARYYSNRFGRWLSSDWSTTPVAVPYANLTNPQTLNLYSMVSDDPESFADLDGHGVSCDIKKCDSHEPSTLKEEDQQRDQKEKEQQETNQPQQPDPNKPPSSWDPKKPFPDDPTKLGPDWKPDPNHDPQGKSGDKRYVNPNGDKVDWHKGVPGGKGDDGKDHWHWVPGGKKEKWHYYPGDKVKSTAVKVAIVTAVVVYVILSESSRVFPPRNLIPVW